MLITVLLCNALSRLLLLFSFIACFVSAANAQSSLDGFTPNANGNVQVVVVQPDGKILIGGDFTTLSPNGGGPVTRNRIARLNVNGTVDTAFNPNADATVDAIALQADGKVLVGGDFTVIGGQTRNRIVRLDAVTGLADSFDPNANGTIYSIAVQADGKILVGGTFSGTGSIGGQTRNRIARLEPVSGAADLFDPNANSDVRVIVVQSDGKILVGGAFNGANGIGGQLRNRIARLDPVSGLADSFNPGATGLVRTIAVQADGKVLAGGAFNGAASIGGALRNRIARLDAVTGAADSFDPNATTGNVYSIAVLPSGKILAGGSFTMIGGQARNRIARLSFSSGAADSFDPNAGGSIVSSLAVQSDGKVLAGGTFSQVTPNGGGAFTRNNIARLESEGWLDRTLDLAIVGNSVDAIATQPDGKILIGGHFTSVLGVARNNIARLNPDGSLDTAFNPAGGADFDVVAIAVQANGKVVVGGAFSTIGGQTRHNIARLDPITGAPDTFDPNADMEVVALALQPNGKILVGGYFFNIGGQVRHRIARLDPVTGTPDGFNPSADFAVTSLFTQADGKIVAGGSFSQIGGQQRKSLARLDATNGSADSFNANVNFAVDNVALQADGKILVSGTFTSIGGQVRNRMARLDPTTGLADSFDPFPDAVVNSIAVQADGKVLIGGSFTHINGPQRRFVGRLDAESGQADLFDPEADNAVYSIALRPDGKSLVGGAFTNIGGLARSKFARLSNDTIAVQDLNVTRTSINWTLGGSSSQFDFVTFEDSTDGVNFNILGNGMSNGNSWTLTGLNISTEQNIFLRARGYYRSGERNGSESIQESVRNAFFAATTPTPTNTPSSTPTATPTATPTGTAMITGTVTYGNAIGAPSPRFVSNVTITGSGSQTVMTTTAAPGAAAGQYTLTGFGSGSYTVTPTKTTGANSITSFDAAKISQHVAGTSLLTGNQLIVADVSNNGTISSFDAAEISNFVVTAAPAGVTGTWRFSPVNRAYPSVTGNITGQDYSALLMGEVSGNWTNTGARPDGSRQLEPTVADIVAEQRDSGIRNNGPERTTAVCVPSLVTPADHEVIIPVTVEGVADKGIISYEFDLRYDPAVIQPLSNPVDLVGTLSDKLSVAVGAEEEGLLRVAVYGPTPINGRGVLLNLKFTAVGASGSVSPLTWERLMFNEGDPATTATDGEVKLSAAAPDQAEITGRLLTTTGQGIAHARVTLIDITGQSRTVLSNGFGVYRFGALEVGQTYTLTVVAKRFIFTPMTVSIVDQLLKVDTIAQQ